MTSCTSHLENVGYRSIRPTVFITFLLLWWRPQPKASWWGKGFFGSQILIIIHHWGKLMQELKAGTFRNWSRSHGGTLLTDLFPMVCSACVFIPSMTTFPGMAPVTISWALPNQLLIKKMPPETSFLQANLMEALLNWCSSSQVTLVVSSWRTNQDTFQMLIPFLMCFKGQHL